jgi:hypothetical protein
LNQISQAAGVGISDILVLSITSGSVTVNMKINSYAPPGTDIAIQTQNSLNALMQSGNVGNMAVTSSSVSTNGGSNDDNNNDNNNDGNNDNSTADDGSNTVLIVLAILLPLIILSTSALI